MERTQLAGHKDSVLCVEVKDQTLASGSEDASARIWDLRLNKAVKRLGGFTDEVPNVAFLGENELVAASGNELFRFDLRRPEILLNDCDIKYDFNKDSINQVSVDPTGEFVAACDDSGEVKVIATNEWKVFKTLGRKHTNICYCCEFRPRRRWQIASGGLDSQIFHWDYSKGKPTFSLKPELPIDGLTPHKPEQPQGGSQVVNPPLVYSVRYTSDGKVLGAGLGNGSLKLYEVDKAKEAATLIGHSAAVNHIRFIPGSDDSLVAASNDATAVVWNWKSIPDEAWVEGVVDITDEECVVPQGCWTRLQLGGKANWVCVGDSEGSEGKAFFATESNAIEIVDLNAVGAVIPMS